MGCREPAGHLDRQLESWANREIMYTSQESTLLVLVHERLYTAILVLFSVVMMIFIIPGLVAVVPRTEHTATRFRFTALALR